MSHGRHVPCAYIGRPSPFTCCQTAVAFYFSITPCQVCLSPGPFCSELPFNSGTCLSHAPSACASASSQLQCCPCYHHQHILTLHCTRSRLIHLLARSLPQSLTHSLTHSLTDSLTHSLTHSLTYSLAHLLTCSLARSLAHSQPPSHTVCQMLYVRCSITVVRASAVHKCQSRKALPSTVSTE